MFCLKSTTSPTPAADSNPDNALPKVIILSKLVQAILDYWKFNVDVTNKELILNNIKVYRIQESENTIEKEFFSIVGNKSDKVN